MDTEGNLVIPTREMLQTMEGLDHPVDSVADLPPLKLKQFRAIEKAGGKI